MKIVINRCFGMFSLSTEAQLAYAKRCGFKVRVINHAEGVCERMDGGYFDDWRINRDDLNLVAVVEKLGVKANGLYAKLKIVEVPDDVDWDITNFDGMESVHEYHRSWA